MIAQHILETAEQVLLRYLAPDAAKDAAAAVAASSADVITQHLTEALGALLNAEPAARPKTAPAPKVAAPKPAPAAKAPKAAAAAKPRKPAAPKQASRSLSDESRKIMSFKKAVYHAKNRAAKKAPEPWDAAILAAHAEGKIISVDRAKAQARAAARAQEPKETQKKGKKPANGTTLDASAPL